MWTWTPSTWIFRRSCADRPTEAPSPRTAPPPICALGRGQRFPLLALLSALESTALPLSGL
jgi:hypothetical protein